MLESITAESALEKPALTAAAVVLPALSSSLILSNTTTLESTAIPIPRIIPAIPGSVRFAFVTIRSIAIIAVYAKRQRAEITPGNLYIIIIKSITRAIPIAPATKLVSSERSPKEAATELREPCSPSHKRSYGSEPPLIRAASSSAYS